MSMEQTFVAVDSLRSQPPGLRPPTAASLRDTAPASIDEPIGTRVVVWGTGECARHFARELRPDVEVVAYVDGNPQKWGRLFNGTPVLAPASLADLSGYELIVIASSFAGEIQAELNRLTLPSGVEVVAWGGIHEGWRCPDLFARPQLTVLQIGITTRCNLLCKHCPRVLDDSVYKDVELSKFKDYLSAFDPNQFFVLVVSDFGEVTMLKNFLAYLRTARELGWTRIEFVTNATNGKRELWDTIFKEGLARKIFISLEGTGEMFETVRGYPWNKFAANVATITEMNNKYGGKCEIVFNAVCMKNNLQALPDVIDFAALHGGAVTFVHLNPSNMENNPLGLPENHMDEAPRHEVVEVFREVKRRFLAYGVRTQLPEDFPELHDPAPAPGEPPANPNPIKLTVSDLMCAQPLRWVEVDDHGNVYPCCQMAKRYPLGNLATNTFDEIWDGPLYRRLIEGLRPGAEPIDVCKTCNMYNGKNF
jgi:radical SAM protein with 4Fe4S-binding SPASM domain